jgi:stage V sporulation protein G
MPRKRSVAVEITEVRIKLMLSHNDKLRAFCSITLDDKFVIRDLKVIEGNRGPFVAMPSRKLMERCPRCSGKNHHRASYCNDCGLRLPPSSLDPVQRLKLHADIAHPINSACRESIQRRILEEYASEIDRAKAPDYRPTAFEVFDEESLRYEASDALELEAAPAATERPVEPRGNGGFVDFRLARRDLPAAGNRGRTNPAPPTPPSRRGMPTPLRGPGFAESQAQHDGSHRDASRPDASYRGAPASTDFRPSAHRAAAPEPEPDDNFGAGLFS